MKNQPRTDRRIDHIHRAYTGDMRPHEAILKRTPPSTSNKQQIPMTGQKESKK